MIEQDVGLRRAEKAVIHRPTHPASSVARAGDTGAQAFEKADMVEGGNVAGRNERGPQAPLQQQVRHRRGGLQEPQDVVAAAAVEDHARSGLMGRVGRQPVRCLAEGATGRTRQMGCL